MLKKSEQRGPSSSSSFTDDMLSAIFKSVFEDTVPDSAVGIYSSGEKDRMGCIVPKVIDFRSLPVPVQDNLMRAEILGDRFLSSAGAGGNCARSMRLPDPSPVLDKICAPIGPKILSSTGAGVWRKAPMAFPDSSSVLDKFQSARFSQPCGQGTESQAMKGCSTTASCCDPEADAPRGRKPQPIKCRD